VLIKYVRSTGGNISPNTLVGDHVALEAAFVTVLRIRGKIRRAVSLTAPEARVDSN
jgi:hypothetical protein